MYICKEKENWEREESSDGGRRRRERIRRFFYLRVIEVESVGGYGGDEKCVSGVPGHFFRERVKLEPMPGYTLWTTVSSLSRICARIFAASGVAE